MDPTAHKLQGKSEVNVSITSSSNGL